MFAGYNHTLRHAQTKPSDIYSWASAMSCLHVVTLCRAFHISEDVFAGYNHTLRGAQTKFLEYISVGKGRDMGFDSINSFESKVRFPRKATSETGSQ